MLRVLLAFTVMLSALNLNAQTDQGRWMVSGVLDADLSLDDDDDATIFSLKPGIAKFIVDRLAVGGNLGIDYNEAGSEKSDQCYRWALRSLVYPRRRGCSDVSAS